MCSVWHVHVNFALGLALLLSVLTTVKAYTTLDRARFTEATGLAEDHFTVACLRPVLIRRATFVDKAQE